MSFRKIVFYALGIGVLVYVVQQLFVLVSGEAFLSYDTTKTANPSPPAPKSWVS